MATPTPDLKLALYVFQLQSPQFTELHSTAQQNLHEAIVTNNLAALYRHLNPEDSPGFDSKLVAQMDAANEVREKELKDAITRAEASEDDTSIVEAWTNLGNWYCQVCDFEKAEPTLRTTSEKTASIGPKIDIALTLIRMGFLYNRREIISRELETIQALIDRGGDWERKNKFKIYRGLYLMSIRRFEEAAQLLIDSFATFTCSELLPYEKMVAYGVVCGTLTLDRVNLKKRVVDSPEVLSLLPTTASLEPLSIMTNSLYTGDYASFLRALAEVEVQILKASPYLASHSAYYVREMRCKAYSQLLESYMSLNLRSMANTFGVSIEYLESDLSRLIPRKKLNCVVDKVSGVVVTNRPDTKNAQYRDLIKEGDALLTKLQKYSAAVRLYGADNQ